VHNPTYQHTSLSLTESCLPGRPKIHWHSQASAAFRSSGMTQDHYEEMRKQKHRSKNHLLYLSLQTENVAQPQIPTIDNILLCRRRGTRWGRCPRDLFTHVVPSM